MLHGVAFYTVFLTLPSISFYSICTLLPLNCFSSIYLLTSPTPQHPHPHLYLLYPQILRLEHQERLDAQKAYELKGTLGGRQSMMNAPQVMRSVRGGTHGVSDINRMLLCVCARTSVSANADYN
jgi:hypothetical protein